jgi:hypothetical protein
MRDVARGDTAHGTGGEGLRTVDHAAVHQGDRVARQLRRGGEQESRRPLRRVLRHRSYDPHAIRAGFMSQRDGIGERFERLEGAEAHAGRSHHQRLHQRGEALLARHFAHVPRHRDAGVRVREGASRLGIEQGVAHFAHHFAEGTFTHATVRDGVIEPSGAVCHELLRRDGADAFTLERRDDLTDRLCHVDALLFRQLGQHRAGEHLGHGADAQEHVGRHALLRFDVGEAVSLRVGETPVHDDGQGGTGSLGAGERGTSHAVETGRPGGGGRLRMAGAGGGRHEHGGGEREGAGSQHAQKLPGGRHLASSRANNGGTEWP